MDNTKKSGTMAGSDLGIKKEVSQTTEGTIVWQGVCSKLVPVTLIILSDKKESFMKKRL
jgi:hypothetical protein